MIKSLNQEYRISSNLKNSAQIIFAEYLEVHIFIHG